MCVCRKSKFIYNITEYSVCVERVWEEYMWCVQWMCRFLFRLNVVCVYARVLFSLLLAFAFILFISLYFIIITFIHCRAVNAFANISVLWLNLHTHTCAIKANTIQHWLFEGHNFSLLRFANTHDIRLSFGFVIYCCAVILWLFHAWY